MCPDARFEKVRIGLKFSSVQGSSLEWGHFGGSFYVLHIWLLVEVLVSIEHNEKSEFKHLE